MTLTYSELGHCQEPHVISTCSLTQRGMALLWRIQPCPLVLACGTSLLTDSLDWSERGGNKPAFWAQHPHTSKYMWTPPSPSPFPPRIWSQGGDVAGVPRGSHSGAGLLEASTLAPSSPLLCLSPPQTQANAFLVPKPPPGPSCPAARWAVWRAAPFPAQPTHSSCQVT